MGKRSSELFSSSSAFCSIGVSTENAMVVSRQGLEKVVVGLMLLSALLKAGFFCLLAGATSAASYCLVYASRAGQLRRVSWQGGRASRGACCRDEGC